MQQKWTPSVYIQGRIPDDNDQQRQRSMSGRARTSGMDPHHHVTTCYFDGGNALTCIKATLGGGANVNSYRGGMFLEK
jgi:hypothetical protein